MKVEDPLSHRNGSLSTSTSPTVLFIAGAGRSGSTLLERLLGQAQGIVAAGEVTHLWHRGVVEDQLCGCGNPFSECDFWSRVMQEAFSELSDPELRGIGELRNRVCGWSRTPLAPFPFLRSRGYREESRRYARHLGDLYTAIARVSGSPIVIDSSKYPSEAHLLSRVPSIRPVVLHLIRDSHAVVHSWHRRKERPEIHWDRAHMPRYPTTQTALAWNIINWMTERLEHQLPYHRLRYEDLVDDPATVLRELEPLLSIELKLRAFLTGRRASLGVDHTVSGNPMRLQNGDVPIRLDDDWVRDSPTPRRLLVNCLTLPLRRRYGYVGRHTTPEARERTPEKDDARAS